jgi:hypothetical protein
MRPASGSFHHAAKMRGEGTSKAHKETRTPERTRTSNRQSRSLVLYPIELPVQVLV